MKRLDEMVRKTAANATSAALSDISSSTSDPAEPGVCPRCGGAGFIRVERPLDHPRFGRAEPCSCVLDEEADVRRARLERISNIGSLTRFTFDTLVPSGRGADSPSFRSALDAARSFADHPAGWLVLSGASGSGKTHLAAAIANQCISLGEPVLFMVVADLLDHLRAGYDAGSDELSFDRLFEQVRNAPLLILDDIDAVAPTAWAREKLAQIVNHRYNAALPTVFTTTERPNRLDDRLASRLCDESLSQVCVLDSGRAGSYLQVGGMTRERLRDFQFGNFQLRLPNLSSEELASLQGAFRAAAAFAEAPRGFFTLMGDSGCGKTHLAAAIANAALARGETVAFVFVPDLLDRLRAGSRPGGDDDDALEAIRRCDLLVLDDLGGDNATPWTQEKLFQIINFRSLGTGATIVTREGGLESLGQPRIAGRLSDPRNGVIVFINAPHYTLGRMRPPEPPSPRLRRRT